MNQKAGALAAALAAIGLLATGLGTGFAIGRATIKPRIEIIHPNEVGADWQHNSRLKNGSEVVALLNKERPRPENLIITISSVGVYHLWYRADQSDYNYTVETLPIDYPGTILNDREVIFGGVGTGHGKEVYVFFRPKLR
jgi:hypothetical protein